MRRVWKSNTQFDRLSFDCRRPEYIELCICCCESIYSRMNSEAALRLLVEICRRVRQINRQPGPDVFLALHFYEAAVELDDSPINRQTQPIGAVLDGPGFFDPVELVKF
jgi:hypothetical protein